MALLRDIHFTDYNERDEVKEAVDALNNEFSGYANWPLINGKITVKSIFRGIFPGDLVGPFISR